MTPKAHPRLAHGHLTLKALLLYYPPAIVLRLHGHDSYVVILIPETADLLGLLHLPQAIVFGLHAH